ncbi:MAG: hypothetical protein PVF91_06190 [Chromatiales bacterium]|jgi:hypothetical protein
MIQLAEVLDACDSASLGRALKSAVERLGPDQLPLDLGVGQGGRVARRPVTATVLSVAEGDRYVKAEVGIFFTEVVGGCSCGDDPVEENAYCELRISIDRVTRGATFDLVGS